MPKNVKQTLYGADLDITHYDKALSAERIKKKINEDVKSTQLFLGLHLPDKMYMTKDQFELLEPDTERMWDTKGRIYHTPHNVMEVVVV